MQFQAAAGIVLPFHSRSQIGGSLQPIIALLSSAGVQVVGTVAAALAYESLGKRTIIAG